MTLKEITNKDIWENFLFSVEEKTFLQSWNWGEFQKKMGNKIWRFGIYDNEKLVSVFAATKIEAKRGTFLLIQHGPAFAEAASFAEVASATKAKSAGNAFLKKEILKSLLEELKKIGKEEGANFIRIAPLLERNEENKKIFQDLGFRKSPMHANAYEETWKLNIASGTLNISSGVPLAIGSKTLHISSGVPLAINISEEELLKNMRKTTRYLIRQAMKNSDITIEKSEKTSDVEIYQNLNKEVAKRQKFIPFSSEYIKNEFEVFSKDNQVSCFFGKYKGEIAAGALVIFWSGIGFYHQAASLAKYARFSIPYLLQWEAIKGAKKRGCLLYDFWGYADPYKFPKHPWAGPTLFKMGFGGYKKEYVKTQDFVISKKYWLNWAIETIRKKRRGF